jgi:hypothetical protein
VFAVFAPAMSTRRSALALMIGIAAGGGLIEYVRSSSAPADFDTATVYLHGGEIATGAFVGMNADEINIAPDLFGRLYGVIATIPRSAVDRISVSSSRAYGAIGTSNAASLLDVIARRPDNLKLDATLAAFLAGFAASDTWKYPPRSLSESSDYLVAHGGEFVASIPGEGVDDALTGLSVSLSALSRASEDYAGEPIVVSGRIIHVAPTFNRANAQVGQFMTLETPARDAVAFCFVPGTRTYRIGRSVKVRGLAVLAGVTQAAGAGTRNGVFIEGSWAH